MVQPQFKTSKIHLTWSRNSTSSVRSIVLFLASSSHHPSWLPKERKEGRQDPSLPSVGERRTLVKEPKRCKISWAIQVKCCLSNSLGTHRGHQCPKGVKIRSRYLTMSRILMMWYLKLRLFVRQHRICQSSIVQ